MGNATSIYNLMRNIGGSFGIATMTTFLARREQVHQNQLISHITPMDLRTQNMFRGLQSWFHRTRRSAPPMPPRNPGARFT